MLGFGFRALGFKVWRRYMMGVRSREPEPLTSETSAHACDSSFLLGLSWRSKGMLF